MKKTNIILLYLFVNCVYLYSQETTIIQNPIEDSVPRYKGTIQPQYFDYSSDELFLSDFFIGQNEDAQLPYGKSYLWLRTELSLKSSGMFGNKSESDVHFLSPLYQDYLENSKFDPVRYVLGMAQLTAVGYLAYKHVKKYGFFK